MVTTLLSIKSQPKPINKPMPKPIRNLSTIPPPITTKSACPVTMMSSRDKLMTMQSMSVMADSKMSTVSHLSLIFSLDANEMTTTLLLPPNMLPSSNP